MIYGFAIPPEYELLYAAGKLIRRGALLINSEGGGIVAHLQETAALAQKAATFATPLTAAAQTVNVATGITSVIQNQQIKQKLDLVQSILGTVQGFQVATLAASTIGIGVSAVGTTMLCQRIDGLRRELGDLNKDLTEFRNEWNMAQIETLQNAASTRLDRLGSISARRNPSSVLDEAEPVLHEAFNEFAARASKLLSRPEIPAAALRVIVDGLAISGGARLKALFLMDEAQEAKRCAKAQLVPLIEMTLSMPADRLADRLISSASPHEESQRLSAIASEMRYRVASIPLLVEHLEQSNFRPSAYLKAAEEEQNAPLMFVPVAPI